MSNEIKTKAIVLHEMPIKENDKRIILFSLEYGKMVVFANGAKRVKSPLLAGTQPFVYGDFHLYEGVNSYTLKQVEIYESFYELREDLSSLYYGLYFLEVCHYVLQENDPNVELMRLLYVSLMALKTKVMKASSIRALFEWRALHALGFAPETDNDLLQQLNALPLSRLYHIEWSNDHEINLWPFIQRSFKDAVSYAFKTLEYLFMFDELGGK